MVTPDGENTWRIISGHRLGEGRRAAPASAQARTCRQSSADGGFLWPGCPPLHRTAEGAGSLRRRGSHHRSEKAGHLPCQLRGAAANGGGPESRSGRLIPPLPRAVRAAQNPIENNGNGTHTRPVTSFWPSFHPFGKSFLQRPQGAYHANFY